MHLPTQELQTIPLMWPFATWGLDLLEPFRRAPRGYTHQLVTINKFNKWIKVKPIVRVRSKDTEEFFLDIIYRFGSQTS